MAKYDLESRFEQAFSAGNNQLGLELLREYNSGSEAHASSFNRQAVIEEQIGNWELAGKAHFACIQSAPQVASAYLYAAYWLEKNKSTDAAASAYSLALEADPTIFSGDEAQSSNKAQRALAGRTLLSRYLKQHHQSACLNSSRISDATWVQTNGRPALNDHERYQPQIFHIPRLSMNPFHSLKNRTWTRQLEAQTPEIERELEAALNEDSLLRPYLEDSDRTPENLSQLAGAKEWSALDLYKDGRLNCSASTHFPKTLAALNPLPLYRLGEYPYEVFFSVLAAGQSIAPHYGQSNHSLTVHLPIKAPDQCYLSVANEHHVWKKSELVCFDDNFEHSAYNNSNQKRIVLLFSIWHPELTDDERNAIKNAFAARRNWMQLRREKLIQLLS